MIKRRFYPHSESLAMPEYFAFFIKTKKQSGQQDMLFCYQADSVRVAYSQLYRANGQRPASR
ncbi:hypothetical protein [Edwardsiella ictaluri]|uniref:hypothetical protein n=1 Tax=Edwardsiella ictaluri TaxID=67780 RepID=UPI0035E01FF1